MSDTDSKTPEQIAAEEAAQAATAIAAGADAEPDYKAEAEKWRAQAHKHEAQAKQNSAAAKKLKEVEDADKSELQKLTEAQASAEKRAEEAELRALRLEVAASKGLSPAQAKRLVGGTKEELETDADELLESFKPADKAGSDTGKPREQLRSGTSPDRETAPSAADLIKELRP